MDDVRSEITKLQCDVSPSESKTFICSVRWNLTLSTHRHERACTLTKQAHIYKVFWSFWSCYMTFLSRWNFPFCHEITDVFLLFLHSWRISLSWKVHFGNCSWENSFAVHSVAVALIAFNHILLHEFKAPKELLNELTVHLIRFLKILNIKSYKVWARMTTEKTVPG